MELLGYFQFKTFAEFNRWNEAKKYKIINIESLQITGVTTFRAWYMTDSKDSK